MSRPLKIGPWGGSGVEPGDLDRPPHPIRLVRVTVTSSEEVVHSIQFSFVDSANVPREAGPWGGTGRTELNGTAQILPRNTFECQQDPIELGDAEHIVHVSGTVGPWSDVPSVITSLKFVTNTGRTYEYGQTSGATSTFDIPLEEGGGQILGFFGRGEVAIDAIGFYIGHTE